MGRKPWLMDVLTKVPPPRLHSHHRTRLRPEAMNSFAEIVQNALYLRVDEVVVHKYYKNRHQRAQHYRIVDTL